MYSEKDIIDFVINKAAVKPEEVNLDTDIFGELGSTGDDFHELIGEYATKYSVDMNNYLWYFHADEEGMSFGSVFFPPPFKRVKRIPVTPRMLLSFANSGKWQIGYPPHKIPKHRIDIYINYLILTVVLFFVIKSCIN